MKLRARGAASKKYMNDKMPSRNAGMAKISSARGSVRTLETTRNKAANKIASTRTITHSNNLRMFDDGITNLKSEQHRLMKLNSRTSDKNLRIQLRKAPAQHAPSTERLRLRQEGDHNKDIESEMPMVNYLNI